jgi:hypothetical protein
MKMKEKSCSSIIWSSIANHPKHFKKRHNSYGNIQEAFIMVKSLLKWKELQKRLLIKLLERQMAFQEEKLLKWLLRGMMQLLHYRMLF